MKIYETAPGEVEEVVAFRNSIFNQIDLAQWQAMNCTGVVAREEGQLVGFIPLQFRDQCLNGETSIPVAYENAVGVAEGRRGQGIGTKMIDEAAAFMQDRVDALMVVRGGERTIGYRFYRKTGHSDVMYAYGYTLPPEQDLGPVDETGVAVLAREAWLAREPELLALYGSQYGRYGGGQRRGPGYWQRILDGHVYKAHKWWPITLEAGDHLAGYLVAVRGYWAAAEDVCVYEVVGEDDEAIERLLRYARRLSSTGFQVPAVSLANPVRGLLRRMGFAETGSTSHIIVRLLRPDRIFARLAAGTDLAGTLSLTIHTPHRTLVVNDPPEARYQVQMETKENLLARLFCCRLDLPSALDTELVRWNGRDPGLKRALCDLFAFSDWVQWFTDYI